MSEYGGQNDGRSEVLSSQRAETAKKAILGYTNLKFNEKVLVLWDGKTNMEMRSVIRDALAKIPGIEMNEMQLTKDMSEKELLKLTEGYQLIINLHSDDSVGDATVPLYKQDVLEQLGARHLALLDSQPEIFDPGGFAEEDVEKVRTRLEKMEAVLREAEGLEISTTYGTQLSMKIKKGSRRWAGVMGMVTKAGQWDNLGAEVFTTPNEYEVDGVLMLPVLDGEISTRQGVDEYIRLEIASGMITSIQGGKSAEQLRKKLEKAARQEKRAKRDPRMVYRVAEIGFGASTGIALVSDENKSWRIKGIPTVLTEKALGSIHIAFGNTDHGEIGTEGVELPNDMHKVTNHFDMVISGAGGLRVRMFRNVRDFVNRENGIYLINEGISGLLGI